MGRATASAAPPGIPTIAVLLGDAARRLQQAGIDGPRSEARWLLAHVLSVPVSTLLAHGERLVSPEAASCFRDLVGRRTDHEPFAYLVGERELYGRRFVVDRRVLVPRPETETLIEAAFDVLPVSQARTPLVIDVGTGSGAIACTLALERPTWRIVASDLSADALAVAAINRQRLGLDGRLPLVRGSLLDWLGEPANLVVANLPYIPSDRVPNLMPEVSRWEPALALDGGADGTDLMRRMLVDAQRIVRPGGTILLELDPEQVMSLTCVIPGASCRAIRDLAGLDRVLRIDLP
jgi:release factor glutamine methyltransferase